MAGERLVPGLTAEIETVVDDKLVVTHMGGEGVLSTPSMIGRAANRHPVRAMRSRCPPRLGDPSSGGNRALGPDQSRAARCQYPI